MRAQRADVTAIDSNPSPEDGGGELSARDDPESAVFMPATFGHAPQPRSVAPAGVARDGSRRPTRHAGRNARRRH